MISEMDVGGAYIAPIIVYALAAGVIFVVCRTVLGRFGLLRRVWHLALFEVGLFLSIVSLLVLFF